ncbi:MAG: hypothetical protein ACTSU5_15695 [Promethearchaeota archaeon]
MKPAEIERFVRENVADSLAQSIDDGLKATALESLQKLVREEAVPADLLSFSRDSGGHSPTDVSSGHKILPGLRSLSKVEK